MKVAFRTDASNRIGTGHFMRCIALADELKKEGAHIRFLSRSLPTCLRDILRTKEIEYISLENVEVDDSEVDDSIDELAHASWLGISQAQDSQVTIKALSDQACDWLIVDHYALDVRWEKALRPIVKHIMVIDDLSDRHHDCDVLLDQNYYVDMETRYTSKVPAHCKLLLGTSYALLREEFRFLREQVKLRNGEVKKVLVFFGGVDEDNYTLSAIKSLSEIDIGLQVDVVIGGHHPFKELIQNSCSKYGFICHVQTPSMAELMLKADLAIGAGGIAMWERCCLGLPTISFCSAENQRKQIADAAEKGLIYSPPLSKDLIESIRLHIQALFSNPPLIRFLSHSGMKFVDGKGALRVTSWIQSSLIEMRKVTTLDSKNLFEWRNNKKIRDVSINSELIVWDEHQKWFDGVMSDSKCKLLIGMIDGEQIGVVRFDIKQDVAEVSIYLVPVRGYSGKGKGLLFASEKWLKINYSGIKSINANVLSGNEASKKLFLSSGYLVSFTSYKKDL
jgi:UDP-2,4-diacetamido-2,4,6-trideoxy-beta-L-altropyranose hydrolase